MLVFVEAEEWDMLPPHQAERDAVIERLSTLRFFEQKRVDLHDLLEKAKALNDLLTEKLVTQREVARSKLLEIRRAESMRQGYGSAPEIV